MIPRQITHAIFLISPGKITIDFIVSHVIHLLLLYVPGARRVSCVYFVQKRLFQHPAWVDTQYPLETGRAPNHCAATQVVHNGVRTKKQADHAYYS